MQCRESAAKYDIPLIADGGINYSGDIGKRWRRVRIRS
jgi:IMP dehydrogenase/GMP reductase